MSHDWIRSFLSVTVRRPHPDRYPDGQREQSTLPTILLDDIWGTRAGCARAYRRRFVARRNGEWVDNRREGEGAPPSLCTPREAGLRHRVIDGMGWGIEHDTSSLFRWWMGHIVRRPAEATFSRMVGPRPSDLVIAALKAAGFINGWSKRVAPVRGHYVRFRLGTPVRDATAGLRLHRASS